MLPALTLLLFSFFIEPVEALEAPTESEAIQKMQPYLGIAKQMHQEAFIKKQPDFSCAASSESAYAKNEVPKSEATLYVFVSLSMPKLALISLSLDAARLGATLVLKGLKDNSYKATAQYLQEMIHKTGNGFLIHPELFKAYAIDKVPTFVLSKTPLNHEPHFDKVSGHISLNAALEKIAQAGDLSQDAATILLLTKTGDLP